MKMSDTFKSDLIHKKVMIIGAARSGWATAKVVTQLNGSPRISDSGQDAQLTAQWTKWARQMDIVSEFGQHSEKFVTDCDLMVLSPGVRFDSQPVQWARKRNIPVMGEIEFASRFCPCPIIAVTGSNGKTTVSTLISLILKQADKNVFLCGNIGLPFSEIALNLTERDYVVLEVSSFQLESIHQFRPHIAVFLNFSQNHLDRHKDLIEYFNAKKRVFANQTPEDYAVLNYQDEHVKKLSDTLKAKVVYFNKNEQEMAFPWSNPDYQAAYAVGKILQISDEESYKVFEKFKGVEHRLELVRTINQVDYVNDSKSTTAEAGRWALENISKPVIMICGGRDKNIDFSVLNDLVKQKVKKMFIIGEARKKIAETFRDSTFVQECEDLKDAVQMAKKSAQPGDCIVLSPMCASFDMFSSFEHRGQVFKEIVNSLQQQQGSVL